MHNWATANKDESKYTVEQQETKNVFAQEAMNNWRAQNSSMQMDIGVPLLTCSVIIRLKKEWEWVRVTGKTSIAHGHSPLPKHKRGELELAQ